MATIKKKLLELSNKRQIKLEGATICIFSTLEVGEGFTRNLLRFEEGTKEPGSPAVINPHNLTAEELMETADYMIGLWMQLKDRVRSHGMKSADIFKRNP